MTDNNEWKYMNWKSYMGTSSWWTSLGGEIKKTKTLITLSPLLICFIAFHKESNCNSYSATVNILLTHDTILRFQRISQLLLILVQFILLARQPFMKQWAKKTIIHQYTCHQTCVWMCITVFSCLQSQVWIYHCC